MRPMYNLGPSICNELLKYFTEFEIVAVAMFIGIIIMIWAAIP